MFSIAAYHQIVSVCIDVPYKPWGRSFCGEMRVFCHNMFVKVYFINMRSDLNINDFIEDKKWHEQGSSIVSKWRSIDFSSKVSAANIPDWEWKYIFWEWVIFYY